MTDRKLDKDEKQAELRKYRDLVLATLDYYVDNKELHLKTAEFDSVEYYIGLKIEVEENFQKGRLTRLKQWFRDLTEGQVEAGDLKFNKYLQDKTKYDINIFKSYYERVDRIIKKGKITTDNQFYDINMMVDQLCQNVPVDHEKIEILNKLLGDYEQRKTQQTRKPTA
ncbi:MAG: hypothetical protein R2818_08530 [Flavobacteriales bacterium]